MKSVEASRERRRKDEQRGVTGLPHRREKRERENRSRESVFSVHIVVLDLYTISRAAGEQQDRSTGRYD